MIINGPVSFQEFQNLAASYAPVVSGVTDLSYAVMSLCGESGEVAEKVKRIYRGDEEAQSSKYNHEIAKELGDVLWCVAVACDFIGYPLEEVARMNIEKMESRSKRGKFQGTGDNR